MNFRFYILLYNRNIFNELRLPLKVHVRIEMRRDIKTLQKYEPSGVVRNIRSMIASQSRQSPVGPLKAVFPSIFKQNQQLNEI